MEVRPLPPAFKEEWSTAERWPVGQDFVHIEYGGRIYIWGGEQRQPEGKDLPLPIELIHIYDPEADLWDKIQAQGEIPRHSIDSSCVVIKDEAFVFGGRDESNYLTNNICSLSPLTGEFKLIPITGAKPASRSEHRGWAFEDKAYFFGGWVGTEYEGEARFCSQLF